MKLILMMALTVDGKIAKSDKHFANWTSKADKKSFVKTTKQAGLIIMGRKTYATFPKPLAERLNVVLTKNPQNYKNIPDLLEFTNSEPQELLDDLQARGYETAILGGGSSINSLFIKNKLVDELLLTIEPKLFGQGIDLFKNLDLNLDLELLSFNKLSANVIQLRYKIIYNKK